MIITKWRLYHAHTFADGLIVSSAMILAVQALLDWFTPEYPTGRTVLAVRGIVAIVVVLAVLARTIVIPWLQAWNDARLDKLRIARNAAWAAQQKEAGE